MLGTLSKIIDSIYSGMAANTAMMAQSSNWGWRQFVGVRR